jgi:hypothetical protein
LTLRSWVAHAQVHLPPRSDAIEAGDAHASPASQRGSDPTLTCALLAHSNVMICLCSPHAQTPSRRGAPTLRAMSPMPGWRRVWGLPHIACPSQGCYPTMTSVTLSHSNAMICLYSPHARTTSNHSGFV